MLDFSSDFSSNLLYYVLYRLYNAVAVGKSGLIVKTLYLYCNPAKVARELGYIGLLAQRALGYFVIREK